MQMALDHAGMKPEDIDYINTHGTSHAAGRHLRNEGHQGRLRRPRQKWPADQLHQIHDRHLLGRRRRRGTAACLMAMQDGIIPPTINVDNQDPECDLDCVPNKAREAGWTPH